MHLEPALPIPIGCIHLMHCHASPFGIVQLFFFFRKKSKQPAYFMIVGQEKLPIQKTCLPRSRQAHFKFIHRIWHSTTYVLRIFLILCAGKPVGLNDSAVSWWSTTVLQVKEPEKGGRLGLERPRRTTGLRRAANSIEACDSCAFPTPRD